MHLRSPCLSALVLAAASFLNLPAIADQTTSGPLQMAQAGSEFDFWNSIKDSKKAEDYQAYLDKYPNGNFADLAKLRMKKYTAAPAPTPAPAAVDPAAAPVEPPAQPAAVEPKAVEPAPATTQPAAPAPATTQPAAPEPATTQPAAPEPATTQPAAPEPAPAQGMTFEAKNATIYARDGGQVRAEPDPKAALVIKLKTNMEVQATGLSSDGRWWRVEVAGGRVGYMHHSVVSDRPLPATELTTPLPATEPTTPLPTTPLPATTQPATPLPTTTQPETTQPTLPATTRPTTPLPETTQPATTQP